MATSAERGGDNRLQTLLSKLCDKSRDTIYDVHTVFDWPDQLPPDRYLMSETLLSVYGTGFGADLDHAQKVALSRAESLNFYSLNIHGIRDLLTEVLRRIYSPNYVEISEYLHHFVDEENKHMWMFAHLCTRYLGEIYPDKRLAFGEQPSPKVNDFVVFARIQLFEELVDYYNTQMAQDESLPQLLRDINRVHHVDESRHIGFGRELVAALHHDIRRTLGTSELAELESYLKRYLVACVQSLYNPNAYCDAHLPYNAYELRRRLLNDPVRLQMHADMLRRPMSFYMRHGIFESEGLPA